MKKVYIIIAALALLSMPAGAQGMLGRLGERAKQAVENSIGNKIEKGVNDLLDGKKDKDADEKADARSSRESSGRNAGAAATRNDAPSSDAPNAGKPGDLPNPYTVFDTPEHAFDVSLGLPENDRGEKPGMQKARSRVSYCAYSYPADGARGKEFWNADRQRLYTVSFEKWHDGSDMIYKFLAIVDSMAIYRIDDASKTITKMPLDAIQSAANHFTVKNEKIIDESEISSSQGRWCYAHTGATESTMEFAGHQSTEVNGDTSYTDLETGIVLEVTHGFAHDYTRNIHLGLYYPEIFDLPKGYKMIVMDLSAGLKQMEEMEQNWMNAEEQMKGLQGKSTEELLQMLKNK